MKKNELEKLEKLNEQKKMTPEIKKKIAKKAIDNFLIASDILLLFIIFMVVVRNLPTNTTTTIYKICSMVFLTVTLIFFEVAYYKNNDEICIYGIEIMFLSIIVLLSPYIFIKKTNVISSIAGVYFALYYTFKNIYIYKKTKSKFIKEQSDIPQIIKKESKDKKAQEEKEKQEQEQANKKDNVTKRKRGRPKKNQSSK